MSFATPPDLHALATELGFLPASLAARGLRPHDEAGELELVETGEDGRSHFLAPAAASAWRRLKAAALADGIALVVVSAFRSIERQAGLVRAKLAGGQTIDEALAVCAPPGFSEHHTGRAVDISTPGDPLLEPCFDKTPAFAWLTRRAGEFGFRMSYPAGNSQGYVYEPWHWCFHDRDAEPITRKSNRSV